MNVKSGFVVLVMLGLSSVSVAQPENKQCELISELTGDYYVQRLEGKTRQQLEQNTPSEFANLDFLRTINLAINLAFSFPQDKTEQQVEESVYATCLKHQMQ